MNKVSRLGFVRAYMEAYKAGKTQEDLCVLLGISKPALRSRLQSVRAACREEGVIVPSLRRQSRMNRAARQAICQIVLSGSALAGKKGFRK